MAGSYKHVVNKKGQLLTPEEFSKKIENLGDAYEAVEEMYGMIWWLATKYGDWMRYPAEIAVEDAREQYKEGVELSPTDRPAMF